MYKRVVTQVGRILLLPLQGGSLFPKQSFPSCCWIYSSALLSSPQISEDRPARERTLTPGGVRLGEVRMTWGGEGVR